MSEIDKRTIRIDQGSSLKLPHVNDHEDPSALQFKYDFAMACAAEARTFAAGSPEHKENLCIAREYLEAALESAPSEPKFHLARAIVCESLGDPTSAVTSLRNAVMYDAAHPDIYMSILQNGSREVQSISPRSISQATINIQEHMVQGDYHAAFTMAHSSINDSIEHETKPNLWHVQLMRIAAMKTGSERIYVETLNALEQRGVLDAQEAEYLPVRYTVTERMRQDMRDESITDGEDPARSRLLDELAVHDVYPINKTAARVGPKPPRTQG